MSLARTDLGTLRGVAEAGVVKFRGVPYATARRFAAPQPVAPWSGEWDATAHGPIAPQPASRLAALTLDSLFDSLKIVSRCAAGEPPP